MSQALDIDCACRYWARSLDELDDSDPHHPRCPRHRTGGAVLRVELTRRQLEALEYAVRRALKHDFRLAFGWHPQPTVSEVYEMIRDLIRQCDSDGESQGSAEDRR